MKLEILINGIESKVRHLEYEDKDLTDTINKTQYYLGGCLLDDDLRNRFNDYITEYSKSYYFSQRDPAFKQLIAKDDAWKTYYTDKSRILVGLTAFSASYLLINYIMNPQNFEELFINILASLGVAGIAKYVESQKKYFAKKFFKMPGREDVFGSEDYNNVLRKNLVKKLEENIPYKIEN